MLLLRAGGVGGWICHDLLSLCFEYYILHNYSSLNRVGSILLSLKSSSCSNLDSIKSSLREIQQKLRRGPERETINRQSEGLGKYRKVWSAKVWGWVLKNQEQEDSRTSKSWNPGNREIWHTSELKKDDEKNQGKIGGVNRTNMSHVVPWFIFQELKVHSFLKCRG